MKNIINKWFITSSIVLLESMLMNSQIVIDTTVISLVDTTNNYYYVNKAMNLTANSFISSFNTYLRLQNSYQLNLFKTNTDSTNRYVHQKYQQTYNGIPIENSQLIFHSDKNARLISFNGKIENNFGNINNVNIISEQSAITSATNASISQAFAWLDTLVENSNKRILRDSSATFFPKPKLLIAKINEYIYNNPTNYFIAYKIPISTTDGNTLIYYVNANNGQVVKIIDDKRLCFAPSNISFQDKIFSQNQSNNPQNNLNNNSLCDQECVQGTAQLLNGYGNQYIYTQKFLYGTYCSYRLTEKCNNGTMVQILNGPPPPGGNPDEFRDATNNWTDNDDKPGTSAYFCLTGANYFWETYLGRNSFDNNYHSIRGYMVPGYSGAFWSPQNLNITIGKDNSTWLTAIDLITHELTHGVSDNECQFPSQALGETGAISEGLSDIFGTVAEFWIEKFLANVGRPANYDFAEDVVSQCGKKRSLIHPEWYCSPNTYMAGPNWKNTNDVSAANDFGGIHFNNGVLNKWFYLLCEGGTGTNDLGNNYCVHGIGQDYASWILYQAMRNYMTSTTNYNNIKFYTELTAFEYFGFSPRYHAVVEAWYAVGLESNPTSAGLPVDIFGVTETSNRNYNYNSRIEATNYKVNSGANIEMTSSDYIRLSADYQYNYPLPATPGNVEIKLGSEYHAYIATGCIGGARFGNTTQGKNHDTENEVLAPVQNNKSKLTNTASPFLVMPNPTTGAFKLQLDNGLEYPKQIVIRDVLGRIVTSVENPDSYEFEFSLSGEKDGVYMVIVYYSDNVLSKRIIKN